MTSIFKIAEQVRVLLDKGAIQDYVASVTDVLSSLVKREFYENKTDGISEVDGSFVYTFKSETPLLDLTNDQYYLTLQSSFLRLPHEMGVVFIGFPKGTGFVRVTTGSFSMFQGLRASVMGNNQTYYIEGARIYFPKMTNQTNGDIICKLAIAYDNVSPDEELNIPRSIINDVVNMVVQKYAPQPVAINEKID